MEVQKDFKELLALCNAHNVDYLIVGAYAPAFYGSPRYTGDMDIFVRPDPQNARSFATNRRWAERKTLLIWKHWGKNKTAHPD